MRHRLFVFAALFLFITSAIVSATEFAGTYRSQTLTVQLKAVDGGYAGTMTLGGTAYPLTAKEKDGALVGSFSSQGTNFDFDAKLKGATLSLNSAGKTFELTREAPANPLAPANPPAQPANPPAPAPQKQELPTGDAAATALKDLGKPSVDPNREWLIINYVDGDNNIEDDATEQIKEMEQGIPDSGVEMIVLFGRPVRKLENGEVTHPLVFHIRKSKRNDYFDSDTIKDLGPIDMADPKYLSAFIEGAVKAFPARRHALFAWDHGGAWQGLIEDTFAPDKPNHFDLMDMPRFRGGVMAGMKAAGLKKWDILTFDMCLMAQFEVAAQVHDLADVMIACEAPEPTPGMPYVPILQALGKGTLGNRRIGSDIVQAFDKYHRDRGVVSTTISALDLTAFDDTNAKLNALADKLIPAMPKAWPALAKSCFYGEQYNDSRQDFRQGEDARQSVDLLDVLKKTRSAMPDFPAEAEFKDLVQAMDRFVIASANSDRRRMSNGISIYAPVIKEAYNHHYDELMFAGMSHWPKLIAALHAEELKNKTNPTFGKIQLVDFNGKPADALKPLAGFATSIEVTGNNMVWVRDRLGVRDAAMGGVKVLGDYYVLDEHFLEKMQKGSENFAQDVDVIMPQLADGPNKLKQHLPGVVTLVTNGEKTVPVGIDQSDLASQTDFTFLALVEHPSLGAKPLQALMHGDVISLNVTSIDLIETTPDGKTIVRQTSKLPADAKITPAFKVIKDDGSEIAVIGATTLAWSKGLSFTLDLMPAGEYEEVLVAETMTGAQTSARFRFTAQTNPNLVKNKDTWKNFKSEYVNGTWAWQIPGEPPTPMGISMDITPTKTPLRYDVVITSKDKSGTASRRQALLILELHDQPFYRLIIGSDKRAQPEVSIGAIWWAPQGGKGRIMTRMLGFDMNVDWVQQTGEGPIAEVKDPDGWRRFSDANNLLSVALPPAFVSNEKVTTLGKQLYPGYDFCATDQDLGAGVEIIRFDDVKDPQSAVDVVVKANQKLGFTVKLGDAKKQKLGDIEATFIAATLTGQNGSSFTQIISLFPTEKGIVVVNMGVPTEDLKDALPTLQKIGDTIRIGK